MDGWSGMSLIRCLVCGSILLCRFFEISAQIPDTTRHHIRQAEILQSDTTITERDRERYEAMKQAASKKKWTDALYSAFFSEPKSPVEDETGKSLDEAFKPYDGRIINNIKIIVLEPFGTSIYHPDSIVTDNWFDKSANSLHVNTKHRIVRGDLLFKEGDAINPLVIAESEAFLRNTEYIHDARIQIDSIPGTRQADITVVVRDVFSLGVSLHYLSFNGMDVELFDKNFLGIGSRFWIRGIYNNDFKTPFGYGIGYRYTNFMKTFINLEGSYLDQIWMKEINLSAERPLQTSLNYYGQISYYRMEERLSQTAWDSINPPFSENFSVSLGRAFNVFDPKSAKRITVAVRYMDNNPSYEMVEPALPDPLQYEYVANRSLLSQISFYSQRYYREYLIHNFGVTENIAYGYNISGQLGYTDCPGFFKGMYTSLEVRAGNQFNFGNLYTRAAVGSHFDHTGFYQGIVRVNGNYFTPLFHVGRARMRNFVNINYANAFNSVAGVTDYVYFSTLTSMRTYYFDQQSKGSERFMLNHEADLFTNLNIVGFRILLFSFFDGGWLKDYGRLFDPGNFYWGLGFGLRIRNDLLVFPTFVIKIGYYPRFNQSLGNIVQFSTTEPISAPSFIPAYPQEILLK